MSDYPLCRAARLQLHYEPNAGRGQAFKYIAAADVEALLARAPVVYGNHDVEGWNGIADDCDTHTARLICVEPIVRDTAEGLLRELLDSKPFARKMGESWIERAKRLLGE